MCGGLDVLGGWGVEVWGLGYNVYVVVEECM